MTAHDPALWAALDALIEPTQRGDPMRGKPPSGYSTGATYNWVPSQGMLGWSHATQAICRPSGENQAPPSYPTRRVIRRTSLPSTFMVYSSMSPSRVLVKIFRVPSGDTVAAAL